MTTSIHAHKVLNLLREQPMSREQLEQTVLDQFGADATFRTCTEKALILRLC
ncbi:hypothetical protein JCM19239_760 [Vibrio variabilis]|uniref:Uncharacterized protein n=1 Tax=Vibrio variabilis TaxID=990271 RepID=A0ABQ0JKF6_9VIBR|nr:hypothetical protein JCM19239_760 [Vibrio variabilis]